MAVQSCRNFEWVGSFVCQIIRVFSSMKFCWFNYSIVHAPNKPLFGSSIFQNTRSMLLAVSKPLAVSKRPFWSFLKVFKWLEYEPFWSFLEVFKWLEYEHVTSLTNNQHTVDLPPHLAICILEVQFVHQIAHICSHCRDSCALKG